MVAAGCFTRPSAIAPKTGRTRSPSIFSQAEFAGPSATPKLRPCLTSRPPLPATPKFPRRIRRKSNVYPLSIRGSSVRLFLLATILSHRLSHIGLHLFLHIDLCRIDVYTRMPTNLAVDDNLILEAQKLGHHRTKKAAVTAALDEYIQRRKQLEIISLFGTIDYDETYNYKRARRMKR